MLPLLKIRGAREHNLRGLDLDLPRDGLIGLAGVSGSGKSSLAIDTLFREGQRRYLETLSPRARRLAAQIDRADVDRIEGLRPAIAVDQRARALPKRSTVATLTEIHDHLAVLYARFGVPHCPRCDLALEPQSAERIAERICVEAQGRRALLLAPLAVERRRDVAAALERIRGLGLARVRIDGAVARIEEELALPKRGVPRIEAVVDRIAPDPSKRARVHEAVVHALELSKGFVVLAIEGAEEILYSSARACPSCRIDLPRLEPALFSFLGQRGACPACRGRGGSIERGAICEDCRGTRLRAEARAVRWKGLRFDELLALPAADALARWSAIELDLREREHGEEARRSIAERLALLVKIGLDHLPLCRSGPALSSGEAQRVRLVAQLGAKLRDVLYVLDEPSAGLHPVEVDALIDALSELRDRGNTVLVVEHDPRVLRALDWLVELGPGAGAAGGAVVEAGPPEEIAARGATPTARALSGTAESAPTPPPIDPRNAPRLVLRGARGHALRGDDFAIPLGCFVAVSGVSGSGKSTLCTRTLVPALERALGQSEPEALPFDTLEGASALSRVIAIEARGTPRGRRSDVATLCGLAPFLRELLAATPEAQWRGYGPKRFSTQVSERRGGGRCEACRGLGRRSLVLSRSTVLPASCDVCGGTRFAPATRAVRFGGLDIVGWLALRVDEAEARLRDQSGPRRVLDTLRRLGLGYLALDQRTADLSGGELQRLQLAAELARPAVSRTLFVLDEPTRGLHPADVGTLIAALRALVDRGDTVLAIEHDEQVLRRAQWIVELGPGAGERGGRIVASGTPAEIALRAETATGRFLSERLDGARPRPRAAVPDRAAASLEVRGARLHNLRALDARFPLGALSVVTGPSGSGKSTLLFDVVHAEGRRRFLESLGAGARRRLGTLARAPHDGIDGLGPTLAVDARDGAGEAGGDLADLAEIAHDLARYFARVATPHCPEHGVALGRLEPTALAQEVIAAWNGAKGYACVPWPRTQSATENAARATQNVASERELLVAQGFLRALVDGEEQRLDESFDPPPDAQLELVLDRVSFDERNAPRLVEAIEAATKTQQQRIAFVRREKGSSGRAERIERDLSGACPICSAAPPPEWNERQLLADPRWSRALQIPRETPELAVSLRDWLSLSFDALALEVARERITARARGGERASAADRILPRLAAKLATLRDLGLGHLDAARDAATLSSGELRRMRLAAAGAAGLDGMCCILDEPSVGLHARDLAALAGVLERWRADGHTLLVVEHAEELIERADYVLELGPGAGVAGGSCVASGSPSAIASAATATGRALRGELFAVAAERLSRGEALVLRGARTRHLDGVELLVRAGEITAVSGVSGAGKTSLLLGTLVPAFEAARGLGASSAERTQAARYEALHGAEAVSDLVVVDARPLARSRRATVVFSLGVWDRLRELFSRVPEARARGYSARTFSFGGTGASGACSVCRGLGERRVDRGFLADLWSICEECGGARFRSDVLEVRWRGLSIADVLELELSAAAEFFAEHPSIARALDPARSMGLGHLRLGQALTALSGGELQRLKLAQALRVRELGARRLFVLDEPSQGLHPVDVAALATSLEALAAAGHAVAFVEHDPLLLWRADALFDLGPGGGSRGGRLLFRGSPADLAEEKDELRGGATGDALRRARARGAQAQIAAAPRGGKRRSGGRETTAEGKQAERRR